MTEETAKLFAEIGQALKEAQSAEANRPRGKPFSWEKSGEGWQIKVHGQGKVRFHFWGNTAGLVKEAREESGLTLQELFCKQFETVRPSGERWQRLQEKVRSKKL